MTDDVKNTEDEVKETPQITAGDLALMVKIIDAGSERGAWKGEELGTIGTIRNKMAEILQIIAPAANEKESESGEETKPEAA